MKAEPLLSLEHISMTFFNQDGVLPVLDDISFSLQQGEIGALLGPSGCGKSTILNILSGLLAPTGGTINRQGTIGYMFQRDHLLDWRTIYDNVCIGLEIQHLQNSDLHQQKIERLLRTYGLWEFRKRYPTELSGGMRQRAALIRTLALEPELLLLDEPFSALDYQTRLMVGDDIGSIIRKEHKTAILVTHDLSEAVSLADRVIVLTKRPGSIQNIITIKFPENLSPFERRNAPEFKDYFNLLWKEMNGHE